MILRRLFIVATPQMNSLTRGVTCESVNHKWCVLLAEYSLFYRALLQKRPIILRSLLLHLTTQYCLDISTCIYIDLYVYEYIYAYRYMYMYTNISISVHLTTQYCLNLCTCMYIDLYMYEYMYMCIDIRICIRTYPYQYTWCPSVVWIYLHVCT